MRRLSILAGLFLVGVAHADPLVDIPTARKLPFGTLKLEFADQNADSQNQLVWLDAGIGKSFEATFSAMRFGRQPVQTSEDLMYSVVAAIPDVSPGIAFGVQDIANITEDRRRFYAVTTFREATETFDGAEVPYDLTIGVYYRHSLYPFAGLSIPLTQRLKVFGEYNGDRPAGGLEFISSRALSFRLLVRGTHTLGDLVWTSHF